MRKPILLASAFILAVVIAYSCKKGKDDGYVCKAGPTADGIEGAEFVVYAVHNGDTLRNFANMADTAMIVYGDSTSPGIHVSDYDDVAIGETGEDHIHFHHLNCGTYYIYRTAFDSVNNARYTGGLGFTSYQTMGEKPIYIQVQ